MSPRLKSLELHGYKTFASRSQFEFPANITAIVGPNGSGKSNVADSIRWVLGEQSYSLLRGRKTEDMIFSGSEQRPRAGMASSTIVFDNEDGWLPIDFSEVSITRRAYRDGDNEYLLNGQRVRLKDISELLAQSGLAERTYTMIGQGLVDAALSLKPDERRRFFEEAAGIGLYRSRREESLNRLETTRRNLERVQDILSELEPRLHSLEKQAKRAIEYDRLKADLRLLLRDWYGYHWHRTQQEMAHAREVLRSQETRLESARRRSAEVDGQMEVARGELQLLRANLNIWHAALAEQYSRWEGISRQLAVMEERERALHTQQQNFQSDRVRLEEEEKAHDDRIASVEDELARLQGELDEANTQAAEVRRMLQKREAERARIDQQLRDARHAMMNSETRQVQSKAHQRELSTRLEDQRRSQQNLAQGSEAAAKSVESARARLESAETQQQQARQVVKDAEAALHDHQKQVADLEAARRKAQEERAQLDTARARLKAQLDVLEQAERSLSGLNQGARFLMQSAQQGKLTVRLRALSGLMDVPSQYEIAIASVLGEYLDAVLLESGSDPEQALQILESGEKGRAVLFPLDSTRDSQPLDTPDDPDCLGNAVSLVKINDDLAPLVRALLGGVLVARDRRAARRLIEGKPAWARVVTLRGEVFLGSGAVIAGQDGRASVIGRPRQKRELTEALETTAAALQTSQTHLQEVDSDLNRVRAALGEQEKAVRQANQRAGQVAQALQSATLEFEQARQRQEWQRKQQSTLEEQIRRTEDELRQVTTELEKSAEKINALNEQVRDFSRQLSALPLEELQSQVVHWNTSAAVVGRAMKEAERRLEENQQAAAANRSRRQTLTARIAETDAALQQLAAEREALRAQESELNQAIETAQARIQPAEADRAEREKAYTDLQAVQASAQQALAVAERYHTQAQLELGHQRDALDSLRRRVEEDFGLVAFEYVGENPGPTPLPLEGMVEQLPILTELPAGLEENISRQRAQMRRMGAINPEAQEEYREVVERFQFLTQQVADLKKADSDLREVIAELDELMRIEFRRTFDAVAAEFKQIFARLFNGGSARLILTDEEHPTETGIDIEARLPGRREQGLSLLSGGERSLTAVALIFSLLKVSPTPFCVMDEVDAMLDEANVGRFTELLNELSQTTQFIVITHNRNTVQAAGVIYGVTMGRDSASQVISLRLDEISEEMVR